MNRCRHCGKIVWFWQDQIMKWFAVAGVEGGALLTVHVACDEAANEAPRVMTTSGAG